MSGFRVATQRVNTPPLHRGPEVVSMVHLRVIPCPKLHFEALGGGLEDRAYLHLHWGCKQKYPCSQGLLIPEVACAK